jgi:tRNA(fMet)-specific endonuclease VapC
VGVIIDSTVIIASERKHEAQVDLIRRIRQVVGEQEIALSAVGYGEIVHGVYREVSLARQAVRRLYLETFKQALVIYPYTEVAAELAGKIDGQQKSAGISIPFPDLLIGATALSLGFSILTANLRHFRLIPNLDVIEF